MRTGMEERTRLTQRQIWLLIYLARVTACTDGTAAAGWLKKRDRATAVELWRRGLVEVWYRQSPLAELSLMGPFYSLSQDGLKLVAAILSRNNREHRGADHHEYT